MYIQLPTSLYIYIYIYTCIQRDALSCVAALGYNWPPYACTYVYEYFIYVCMTCKQRDALSCLAALGYTACAGAPLHVFTFYLRRYELKRDAL